MVDQEFQEFNEEANLKASAIIFGKIVGVVGLDIVACFQRQALTNLVNTVGFKVVDDTTTSMAWVDTKYDEDIECQTKMN